MRILNAINILLLLGIVLVTMGICLAFPVPLADRGRSWSVSDSVSQKPPDKCPRGVCDNKGRICEVICKNNPSEGGKFCNCDTYALRASRPSFADCNRLI